VRANHRFIILPSCKAYPIAILLHDHCAIYAVPSTPLLYAIHHTILVMAILCKGQDAAAFNQDLSAWDVSAVATMSEMFRDAAAFNHDLSAWDVSAVATMYGLTLNPGGL